jgi:hypothetical protein
MVSVTSRAYRSGGSVSTAQKLSLARRPVQDIPVPTLYSAAEQRELIANFADVALVSNEVEEQCWALQNILEMVRLFSTVRHCSLDHCDHCSLDHCDQ